MIIVDKKATKKTIQPSITIKGQGFKAKIYGNYRCAYRRGTRMRPDAIANAFFAIA